MNQNSQKKLITLLPLFFVLVIETMGFGILFPVLGPMFLDKGSSIVDPSVTLFTRQFLYGLTLGIFSLATLFGAPILGDLSDRWGRRNVIISSLVGSAIALFICAIAIDIASISLLIIGRILGGFFAGSQTIAQAAIADISSEEDKTINMSLIIFANCIGFIIGPIFGGYFADTSTFTWSTYATPFYAAGILTVLNALMVVVMFKETYLPEIQSKVNIFRGLSVFVEAFQHKQIRLLSIVNLLAEMGWSMFFLYLTLFLVKQYGFHGVQVGHYMSYYGVVWGLSLTLLVRLIVKYFKVETIVWQSLFLYGAFVFLMLIPSKTVLWLLPIPIGVGSALSFSALVTVFSNSVDKESQGWVMGVNSAVLSMGWGLGAVFAGLLASVSDSLPFIIGAILIIISGGVMMMYETQVKNPAVA